MVVNKEYDLVVIGGGIIGIMTSYLAKVNNPSWNILLVDKGLLGMGATAYSAYLDMPYGVSEYKQKLTKSSRETFKNIWKEFPEIPISQREFIGFSSNIDNLELSITDDCAKKYANENGKHHFLDDVKLINTNSYLHDFKAYVYGFNVVQWLISKITELGINILESVAINAVKKTKEAYLITSSFSPNKIQAKRIIEATGPFMHNKPLLEGSKPIEARSKKIVSFYINKNVLKTDPVYYFFDDDAFLLPMENANKWLFSYKCTDWGVNTDSNQFFITEKNKKVAQEVLDKYLSNVNLWGGRVFCDLYHKSGDPCVDKLDDGYIRIGATAGSGVRLSPGLALEALSKLKQE